MHSIMQCSNVFRLDKVLCGVCDESAFNALIYVFVCLVQSL